MEIRVLDSPALQTKICCKSIPFLLCSAAAFPVGFCLVCRKHSDIDIPREFIHNSLYPENHGSYLIFYDRECRCRIHHSFRKRFKLRISLLEICGRSTVHIHCHSRHQSLIVFAQLDLYGSIGTLEVICLSHTPCTEIVAVQSAAESIYIFLHFFLDSDIFIESCGRGVVCPVPCLKSGIIRDNLDSQSRIPDQRLAVCPQIAYAERTLLSRSLVLKICKSDDKVLGIRHNRSRVGIRCL